MCKEIIVSQIMGKILCNKQEKGQNNLNFDLNKITKNHECKTDFEQKLMKRVKKRFIKDQFLNSNYARKQNNFVDILVFLFGLFHVKHAIGVK